MSFRLRPGYVPHTGERMQVCVEKQKTNKEKNILRIKDEHVQNLKRIMETVELGNKFTFW